MSSIDERIVNMKFNASQFQSAAAQTLGSLDNIKKGLDLSDASKGLSGIDSKAEGNASALAKMAAGVSNISSKFSALGAIGFSVINNLTNTAIGFIKNTAGKVLDPIIQGGTNRAHAIEQAKFQFKGLGLDIQKTMDASLAAVKGTSFGLDEAATAAAQFGASGITATKGLTPVLKSVAGVAAQTGSSFSDIATIFEGVAGNGRVMGDDLLQLSSRGVNAAAILGKSLGKSEADVRTMVSAGKIDFKTFSDAMNKAFGANAAKASETYAGALSNMHAALSRVGADSLAPKFEAERKVLNALTPVIDNIHAAIQPVQADFGRLQNISADGLVKFLSKLNFTKLAQTGVAVVDLLDKSFGTLQSILTPLKQAFADVFPATTTNVIRDIVVALGTFIDKLQAGPKQMLLLRESFRGIFAIFDIGIQLFKAVFLGLGKIFGAFKGGNSGVLSFTASVGNFLVAIDGAIRKGDLFTKFFEKLGSIIAVPVKLIGIVVSALLKFATVIGNLGFGAIAGQADAVNKSLHPLVALGNFLEKIWNGVKAALLALGPILAPLGKAFASLGAALIDSLTSAFKTGGFSGVLDVINTGLLAGIVLLFKNFFKNGLKIDFGGGFLGKIKEVFGGVTDTLGAMQAQLKAEALKKIAIAIAILVAAIFVLSTIDSGKLTKSLAAITVMFGQLVGALAVLNTLSVKGVSKLPIIAGALTLLAGALLLMSVAVKVLSTIDPGALAKGLGAIAVILGEIAGFSQIVGRISPIGAAGLLVMALAINILAAAVAILGNMDLGTLAKGLGAMAIALGIVVGAIQLLPKTLVLQAAGLLAISLALNGFASALLILGKIPTADLAKGLGGLAIALVIIAGAIKLFPKTLALQGVGLVIIAGAIAALAGSLKILAGISIEDLIKSLSAMAIALGILAAAMAVMTGGIAGAVAVGLMAAALAILVPTLVALSLVPIGQLAVALGALVAIFVIFGVAAVALTEVIPIMLALGLALLAIGLAVALAGAGVLAFAAGLAVLATLGAAGAAGIVAIVTAILGLLPLAAAQLALAIIAFANTISTAGPTFVAAMTTLILSLLTAINNVAPKIVTTLFNLLNLLVQKLTDSIPKWAKAALNMVISLLNTIANKLPDIITAGTNVIVALVEGLGKNSKKIAEAAATAIVDFVNGIADAINDHAKDLRDAGLNVAKAIADGMTGGLASKAKGVADSAFSLGKSAIANIKKAVDSNSPSKEARYVGEFVGDGFGLGMERRSKSVAKSAGNLGGTAIASMKSAISKVGSLLTDNVETAPTIRPVLDLSDIKKNAGAIGDTIGTPSIKVDTAYVSANNTATGFTDSQASKVASTANDTTRTVALTQNNYSPKALSTVDIYRQTKNQLSTIKDGLTV